MDPYKTLSCLPYTEKNTQLDQGAHFLLAERAFRALGRRCAGGRVGFALFNKQGVLAELYGTEDFYLWAETQKIQAGTVWSEERLGANAVASGLRENMSFCSSGPENYSVSLLETAIYFSPVNAGGYLGGIAVLAPYDERHGALLGLSVSLAINLGQEISRSIHAGHDEGLLVIDICPTGGVLRTCQYNDRLACMLDIPPERLHGCAVEEIFDPLPCNPEFWDIIADEKDVWDRELSLSVRGNRLDVLLSAEAYVRPLFGQRGVYLFLRHAASKTEAPAAACVAKRSYETFDTLIGKSDCYMAAVRQLKSCAQTDANVLMQGESGTGKDVLAQALHQASRRRGGPFIAINCAAFPRELIFSELFGYEGGAFTGSKRRGSVGKFEMADSGTLFLDEIGDMPLELQAVLLRVIEEKCFTRIGGNRVTHVNIKIVSATNADLFSLVQKKLFRLDLYYRLSSIQVRIPPLRERGEDIILLAEYFIENAISQLHQPRKVLLSESARDYLTQLPWYGNIRELRNMIEGVVNLYLVQEIEVSHISEYISRTHSGSSNAIRSVKHTTAPRRKPSELTAGQLRDALIHNKYNKSAAAMYLGISRRTLYRKLGEFEELRFF